LNTKVVAAQGAYETPATTNAAGGDVIERKAIVAPPRNGRNCSALVGQGAREAGQE